VSQEGLFAGNVEPVQLEEEIQRRMKELEGMLG